MGYTIPTAHSLSHTKRSSRAEKWTSESPCYPVVVRFDKVNYAGVSTNNYALDEIEYN
jgi:hypothetical protein